MRHQTDSNESTATAAGISPAAANGAAGDRSSSGVRREYHDLLADLEDLISSATSLTGEDLARVKARLTERISSAKVSLGKLSDSVTERARSGVTTTDRYVRAQPWQAVGITAVVGVLVGFMLGRRGS